ncbi:acetylcholinesterase-1 [Ixodes scapularis]|uniref:acetylcholinesterase-1 n=1 Tax=Ixodes scapularis TaxID=6945 RepID=UPI001C38A508|nr:acetylcholinesterase-1 [Ixodes scapularis]
MKNLESVLRILLVLRSTLVLSSAVPIAKETRLVQTESGLVSGIRLLESGREVDAFLGVPNAEPPVGQLRFRRPQPKLPWEGVYSATNLVFVTFNYRLSIFGFLSNESPEVPGNMGFWDQNLVLRWVHGNIENFGGDPSDVTLIGHSTGGTSAGFHTVSPHSKGLFRKVIMQSGIPLSSLVRVTRSGIPSITSVAKNLGCLQPVINLGETFTNVAACLRDLNATFIFEALYRQDPSKRLFSPSTETSFFQMTPYQAKPGRQWTLNKFY